MKFKTSVAIGLILLIVIFTIQNTEVVSIKFLFWQLSMSRVLVLLSCFILGLVTGMLIFGRHKKQH